VFVRIVIGGGFILIVFAFLRPFSFDFQSPAWVTVPFIVALFPLLTGYAGAPEVAMLPAFGTDGSLVTDFDAVVTVEAVVDLGWLTGLTMEVCVCASHSLATFKDLVKGLLAGSALEVGVGECAFALVAFRFG